MNTEKGDELLTAIALNPGEKLAFADEIVAGNIEADRVDNMNREIVVDNARFDWLFNKILADIEKRVNESSHIRTTRGPLQYSVAALNKGPTSQINRDDIKYVKELNARLRPLSVFIQCKFKISDYKPPATYCDAWIIISTAKMTPRQIDHLHNPRWWSILIL